MFWRGGWAEILNPLAGDTTHLLTANHCIPPGGSPIVSAYVVLNSGDFRPLIAAL